MRAPQGIQAVPDVTRPELKVRGRPFFFPTLHVRKTRMCHRGAWKAGWEFPDVTRPEQKVRERPFFFLTLYVGKTGEQRNGEVEQRNGEVERRNGKWSGKTGLGSATE